MSDKPKKLGKYEITEELGRGAMGVVYEGYDAFLKRHVAVKVANLKTFQNADFAARYKRTFFNEANTAGKLKHPNIIEILDASVEDDIYYIVMELVKGGSTLAPYCKPENLLSYKQVAEIVSKCAKALDYAHRIGVIHRDIKPTNILLTEDLDIRLCDFSVAQLMTEEAEITMPTGFIGSPRYMSPEQIQEDSITHQADLFSLGVIMYELLVGKHPFEAKGFSRLIYKITNEEPPLLSNYRTDIPEIFEKIVRHALQKEPEYRYKMGSSIVADLSIVFDHLDDDSSVYLSEKKKVTLMQDMDFFKPFAKAEIWEIIWACEWQEYENGEEIVLHSEIEDALFVNLSGNIDVYKDSVQVGNIGADDCFGRKGSLSDNKFTVNFYAREAVHLLKINHSMVDRLSVPCQQHFTKVFLSAVVKKSSFMQLS